jgi:hypothetical protein
MATHKDFDIRGHLKHRFPEFFLLLAENKINWRGVNKAYAKKANEYRERHERIGQTFTIGASIYDIIIHGLRGDVEALRALGYIKGLFNELAASTTTQEKNELSENLYAILTNVDLNYRNFVGELSVLYFLKKRMDLILLQTEKPLFKGEPKGVKIDFHLKHPGTNKEYLFEVINIRVDETNTDTQAHIGELLQSKISCKLLETGIQRSKAFTLIVVLWGNWICIRAVAKYYETAKPQFENTAIPLCFVPFTDSNGENVFKFGTIDTIFEGSSAM